MKKRGFEICKGYEDMDINLPVRKTKNAVGYDFEAAEEIVVHSIWRSVFENIKSIIKGEKADLSFKPTLIKTGIKSYFGEDEVLIIANRSSNPIKKGLILANSIGIIDSDYYENEDNDGHLLFSFYNIFPFDVTIKKHEVIGQGYFQKFLIADDDDKLNTNETRKGGFGSTEK